MATSNKKNPSNNEIFMAIGALQEKVDAIHIQTKKTNGRVTRLEQWKEKADVIANYLKEHPAALEKTPQERQDVWTKREKTLLAIISSLITIVGGLIAAGKL